MEEYSFKLVLSKMVIIVIQSTSLALICLSLVLCASIKDEFDEAIFDFTMDHLIVKYSNDSVKANCVLNYLKDSKSIESFYTAQLLFESDKLERELEPFLPKAEKFCNLRDDTPNETPVSSPSGIGIFVGVVSLLLVVLAIVGLVRMRTTSRMKDQKKSYAGFQMTNTGEA